MYRRRKIKNIRHLGSGKTLTLTYLGWNNYYYKNRQVCSNYNLYGIPFTPIKSVEALRKMIPSETQTTEQLLAQKEVVFLGDELWRWIDARTSAMDVSDKEKKQIKNKMVTDILSASRKAFVTVCFTSQTIDQVDRRIRSITDFTVYPIIKGDNQEVEATVFLGPKPSAFNMERPIRFYCEPFMAMYNTYERIPSLEEFGTEEEKSLPIETNPAWVKYLTGRKFNTQQITDYSIRMTEMLLKPQ